MGNDVSNANDITTPILEALNDPNRLVDGVVTLPDNRGYHVLAKPVPSGHWLTYAVSEKLVPPMPFRLGLYAADDRRVLADAIKQAGRYAIVRTLAEGNNPVEQTSMEFDPDTLLDYLVVGLLGYATDTGLSADDRINPAGATPLVQCVMTSHRSSE